MTSRSAALRAAAEAIDAQESKRDALLAAKEAYFANRSDPAAVATYRALAREYDGLRLATRGMAVAVPTDGRSTTVVPSTVGR